MKSISKRMKSIYALAVMVLVCACMLIVPATKTVKAATPAEASNLKVISAQVALNKEQTKWAIMFKAEIDLASYNVITTEGADAVEFGMLVGPSWAMASVTDYDTAIAAKFKAFNHAGTSSAVNASNDDNCVQVIDFRGADVYNYYAGIVYDAAKLGEANLKEVAALELTAIPYYVKGGEKVVVLDNAKATTPSNVLVESYVQEQVNGIDNIKKADVDSYAGTITLDTTGEYYVSKATNSIYKATTAQTSLYWAGDLVKEDMDVASTGKVFVAGKNVNPAVVGENLDTTQLDSEVVATLKSTDNFVSLVVYNADGSINAYPIKIAERVILRWAKNYAYDNPYQSSALPATDEEDFILEQDGSKYRSIFAVAAASKTFWGSAGLGRDASTEIVQSIALQPTEAIDGLYVLGKTLSPLSSGLGPRDVYTMYIASMKNRIASPVEGKGFVGVFDGRGKTIAQGRWGSGDTGLVENWMGGFFPTASNATIKNVGFNMANPLHEGDGWTPAGGQFMFGGAINTTFENIFVNIQTVKNVQTATYIDSGKITAPIIGSVENCTIKNFVIKADYLDVNADPTNVKQWAGQQFNSLLAFHTHTNGNYSNEGYIYNGSNNAIETPVFAGNTVENLFAVGSATLYEQQQMGDGGVVLSKATYLVNPNSPLAPTEGDVTDYITLADLEAEGDADKIAEFNEYANLATKHKQFIHTKATADTFLEQNPLRIRFMAKVGAYDFTAAEMGAFIADANNAEAIAKFDSKYWTVNKAAGTIAWKGAWSGGAVGTLA